MDQSHSDSSQEIAAYLRHPGWLRATTLTERLASLRAKPALEPEFAAWRKERAEQTLRLWKAQPPFQQEACFADRLQLDGMTESDLLTLLAESCEALHERMPLPDWLQQIGQAFAAQAPWAPECEISDPTMAFLRSLQPLLAQGHQKLWLGIDELARQHAHVPFAGQQILPSLFASLLPQLLTRVNRTCALELRVAGSLGHLKGSTSQERFQYFVDHLCECEVTLSLLEEYSVLARQLVLVVNQWVDANLELLRRLCVDWPQICSTLTPDSSPGQLLEVRRGASDRHRDGRSVMLLRFTTGFQLVYKPKSLSIDLHFQEALRWLNQRGSHLPFQTFPLLDRGSYGWSAFLEARECQSAAEVQHFYERQGAYLALLYALGAADFHAENSIAQREHPMLIDLEALFHPHLAMPSVDEPAFIALQHSVMRVGLLPQHIWGTEEARGINMSGLGGEQGQIIPRAVPKWEGAGTDQMRLVRTHIEIAVSKNRPTLKGRPVDVLDYQDRILAGFHQMYQTLLNHREAFLSEILPGFAQDEIRFIARPTDIYMRFLYDSFRPELLRDALERDRHFDRLWVGIAWQPHMARLIPAERTDLLRGDIPLFTTRPVCQDLFTSQGEIIPNFFQQSGSDQVRTCIQQLDAQDLARQLWMIRASFLCMAMDTRHDLIQPAPPQSCQTVSTRSEWFAAARVIGDTLCQSAILKAGSAGWLGMIQVREQEWEVMAAGLDVYNGLPGIALFLAYLAELTAEVRYLDYAQAALQNIRALLQSPRRHQVWYSIGAFEGIGGLIYLFTHLGTLWKKPELFQEAEMLVKLLPDLIEHDEAFDVVAGSAGCIAALLCLQAVAPSVHTLAAAVSTGDHLLIHAQPQEVGIGWKLRRQVDPLTGMAHGGAGIALQLLRLAKVSGVGRFREAALATMAYERGLFSPEQQNWPDLRKQAGRGSSDAAGTKDVAHFMVAWCHGASGIALARMASLRYLEDDRLQEEIAAALATTIAASEKIGSDPTLCHGTAGLLETLLTASEVLSADVYTLHVERLAQQLLTVLQAQQRQEESQASAWWMAAPGLMQGLAGIGYTLLRLVDPAHVPSVLTLAEPCFRPL